MSWYIHVSTQISSSSVRDIVTSAFLMKDIQSVMIFPRLHLSTASREYFKRSKMDVDLCPLTNPWIADESLRNLSEVKSVSEYL